MSGDDDMLELHGEGQSGKLINNMVEAGTALQHASTRMHAIAADMALFTAGQAILLGAVVFLSWGRR